MQIDIHFEVKALAGREFEGHGSIFRNVDLGGDIVVPGAFKRSLSKHKSEGTMPLMFWMHQSDQVPGVWKAMREDKEGLYVKGELVDTQLGNEMHTLLTKKAVRGLSIGYRTNDYDWDADGNRLLKEIDLWEVSIVSMAMNPLAQVEAAKARLSAMGEYVPTLRQFERWMREKGCSRSVAHKLAARLLQSGDMLDGDDRRDSGDVEDEEAQKVLDSLNGLVDRVGAAALRF